MFSIKDAFDVAEILDIKFDKFPPEDLLRGLNIELEHGYVNPITNVTNNDLIMTAKIVLAHLMEFPNYYNDEYGLPAMEKELKKRLNMKEKT